MRTLLGAWRHSQSIIVVAASLILPGDMAADVAKKALPSCVDTIRPDIVVTSTSDSVDFGGLQTVEDLPGADRLVSLREAIIAANNSPGPQVIAFAIPRGDPGFDGRCFIIKPLQTPGLPGLFDDGTTIDGTSQTRISGDTNRFGPEIVLDGGQLQTVAAGLNLMASHCEIRGLVIHGFRGAGIQFIVGATSPDFNRITQCYIGTNETGTDLRGNGWQGIAINGVANTIGGTPPDMGNIIAGNCLEGTPGEIQVGGPSSDLETCTGTVIENNLIGTDRTGTYAIKSPTQLQSGIFIAGGIRTVIRGNLISGNSTGIVVMWPRSTGNRIEGNLIGTDATGVRALGNQGWGIQVELAASGTTIFRNKIAHNRLGGVGIGVDSAMNRISRNQFAANEGLAIDLGSDGATANDVGDQDAGANDLQNSPVLVSAIVTSGQILVRGSIDTIDPRTTVIEFFATPRPRGGGNCPAHRDQVVCLGSARPSDDGSITALLPLSEVGSTITATATDALGNTSEFCPGVELTGSR